MNQAISFWYSATIFPDVKRFLELQQHHHDHKPSQFGERSMSVEIYFMVVLQGDIEVIEHGNGCEMSLGYIAHYRTRRTVPLWCDVTARSTVCVASDQIKSNQKVWHQKHCILKEEKKPPILAYHYSWCRCSFGNLTELVYNFIWYMLLFNCRHSRVCTCTFCCI